MIRVRGHENERCTFVIFKSVLFLDGWWCKNNTKIHGVSTFPFESLPIFKLDQKPIKFWMFQTCTPKRWDFWSAALQTKKIFLKKKILVNFQKVKQTADVEIPSRLWGWLAWYLGYRLAVIAHIQKVNTSYCRQENKYKEGHHSCQHCHQHCQQLSASLTIFDIFHRYDADIMSKSSFGNSFCFGGANYSCPRQGVSLW